MPSVRRRTKVEPRPWLVKEPPASETDGYRVIAFVDAFCRQHSRAARRQADRPQAVPAVG